MTRKASQTVTNPISRSGMAQPASIPPSQIRNGVRQRAGEISARAAISENARHMIQKLGYANAGTKLEACRRQKLSVHRRICSEGGSRSCLLRNVFLFVKECSCSKLKILMSQLRSFALKTMFRTPR